QADVSSRLVSIQRPQRTSERDALFQLAELGGIHLAVELRLPGKHDLQQLPAPVFQIAQKPDLFEHVPLEVVRLVHNQRCSASRLGPFEKQLRERKQYLWLGVTPADQ